MRCFLKWKGSSGHILALSRLLRDFSKHVRFYVTHTAQHLEKLINCSLRAVLSCCKIVYLKLWPTNVNFHPYQQVKRFHCFRLCPRGHCIISTNILQNPTSGFLKCTRAQFGNDCWKMNWFQLCWGLLPARQWLVFFKLVLSLWPWAWVLVTLRLNIWA